MHSFIDRQLLAIAAALLITFFTGWAEATSSNSAWSGAGNDSAQNIAWD